MPDCIPDNTPGQRLILAQPAFVGGATMAMGTSSMNAALYWHCIDWQN
jgi:hypothetical protein